MKKKDIILLILILAGCGVAALFIFLFQRTEGNYVQITINGEYYAQYDLDVDQTIEIDTEYGHNVLEISDGQAIMIEADCPDGYCMNQGYIKNNGQTIVCLPHKLVAEIIITDEDGSDSDIDGIAK